MYRVFLLNEHEKSFFCDSECYWNYNYPSEANQTESWKIQARRYGLPETCGIDWDAKLKNPEDCWDDDGGSEHGMATSDGESEMSGHGTGSNGGGAMDM